MLPFLSNHFKQRDLAPRDAFVNTLVEGYHFDYKDQFFYSRVRSVCYDKKENSLLISYVYSKHVHIINLTTGKLRWFDHHGHTVRKTSLFNDQIISASWDGTVCVTDFFSLERKSVFTDFGMGRCPSAILSPDGRYLYAYSYDSDKNPKLRSNVVRKWDMITGQLIYKIQLPGNHLSTRRCGTLRFYNDKLYVVSDSGHLHVFDCKTGMLTAEKRRMDQLQSLCILPDYNLISMAGMEGYIYLHDLSDYHSVKRKKAHSYDITSLMQHPLRPNLLISTSFDEEMKIWSLPDLELINTIHIDDNCLWSATISEDLLIVGGEDPNIWIYDIINLPEVACKGKLAFSGESFAFVSANLLSFYTNNLESMCVKKNNSDEIVEGQFSDYLLNSACDLNVLRKLFCTDNSNAMKLDNPTNGLLQLNQ